MLNSFLFNKKIIIREKGIDFLNVLLFYDWHKFIDEDYVLHFQSDNIGLTQTENLFQYYRSPFPIVFHWVDIYSLSNPKNITRIHFPKGEIQKEEFKNLCAYYILECASQFNNLTFSNNKEVNDLILKIFR